MVMNGFSMNIKDEKTLIITYEDKVYEFELLTYVVDEKNQIITYITDKSWQGSHNVQNYQEINTYRYMFIYDGNEIINTILYLGNFENYDETLEEFDIYWQNENGIKADIEGTFVEENGERTLTLYPDKMECDYFDTWSNRKGKYVKINGYYLVTDYSNWEPLIIQDENTVTYDGYTFKKQVSN